MVLFFRAVENDKIPGKWQKMLIKWEKINFPLRFSYENHKIFQEFYILIEF